MYAKLYTITTQNSINVNVGTTTMHLPLQQRYKHFHCLQRPSRNTSFISSSVVLSCGLNFPICNEGVSAYTDLL